MMMRWQEKLLELKLTPLNGVSFEPLTEPDLRRIELHLSATLPCDYRLFLSLFGSADFDEYCLFPTLGGGVAPGRFFGHDLEDAIVDWADRLSRQVIPINDDGASNVICLSLRDQSYGDLFFQHHSVGADQSQADRDRGKFETMTILAFDFASFICGLEIE